VVFGGEGLFDRMQAEHAGCVAGTQRSGIRRYEFELETLC